MEINCKTNSNDTIVTDTMSINLVPPIQIVDYDKEETKLQLSQEKQKVRFP